MFNPENSRVLCTIAGAIGGAVVGFTCPAPNEAIAVVMALAGAALCGGLQKPLHLR